MILQHLPIEGEVGDELSQLRVLVLELLQLPHLERSEPLIFLLPAKVGCWADPVRRQISAIGTPSAPCFRMNAFCATENFDAFIVFHSSQPRDFGAENSQLQTVQFSGIRSPKYEALIQPRLTAPRTMPH